MGNPIPVHLEQECRKATKILNDFVDPVNGLDKIIPLSVLQRAKGFAIFSVFRIGFLLSARAGSGVVIARTEDGRWSAPAAIGIGGLGGGFNVGAEVTDFLIVLNSRSAVRSFMATGSLQLGGNLSVAIGPLGRSAEASGSVNTKGRVAAMFSYSKSKGFYGGISVEGTVLVDREDANARAYGSYGKNAKQILSGSVEPPRWATGLIQTIDRFTLANTPSKDLDGEYFNYDDTSSFDNRGLGRSGGRRSSFDSVDSRELDATVRTKSPLSKRESGLDDLPDRFDGFDLGDRKGNGADAGRSSFEAAERDRRARDEYDARPYAFGSPSSSLSNTPARVGSAASQKKRPGIRQRSSSIASNLSFSSLGGKKRLDRSGPTPPPDWNDIPATARTALRGEGAIRTEWMHSTESCRVAVIRQGAGRRTVRRMLGVTARLGFPNRLVPTRVHAVAVSGSVDVGARIRRWAGVSSVRPMMRTICSETRRLAIRLTISSRATQVPALAQATQMATATATATDAQNHPGTLRVRAQRHLQARPDQGSESSALPVLEAVHLAVKRHPPSSRTAETIRPHRSSIPNRMQRCRGASRFRSQRPTQAYRSSRES